MLLSENNIKAELSYAYLHAVASRAGFACEVTGRHSDGAGIDAILRVKEKLAHDSTLISFTVEVQLKATSRKLVLKNEKYSLSLDVKQYDKLRTTRRPGLPCQIAGCARLRLGDWLEEGQGC
ncbi:MAG: DUF4365 domain-containing protein [Phycisphaerae bacterium]|nr:DUF4365 domain-containing protein [Phycisphaerae bacterium]